MSRIVFLLEDYSMKVLLDGMLPRLLPGLDFLCVPHEGKQDLDRSIPRKLRAWREPGVQFVILRDSDQADCAGLKSRLVDLCRESGRPGHPLVRLACQELESWYLGDPAALADALGAPSLRSLSDQARFRDPDAVVQPARALEQLAPRFQKISGARAMAGRLDPEANASRSFRVFIDGVRRVDPRGATDLA